MSTPRRLTIEIPLPPVYLRAQVNGNRMVRAMYTKKYRKEVKQICQALYQPQFQGKVYIDHFWYYGEDAQEKSGKKSHKKYRPMDAGNAIQAMKAAVDGIVDSGLLIDDKAAYVAWGEFVRYGTKKEHQGKSGIVLVLTETDQKILPTQRNTGYKKPPQVSGVATQGELF